MTRFFRWAIKIVLLYGACVASAWAQAPDTPAAPRGSRDCSLLYPSASLRANNQGTTVISATIQTDGTLRDVSVATSSGFKPLDDAAVLCVSAWTYMPAKKNGVAVESTTRPEIVWKVNNINVGFRTTMPKPNVSDITKKISQSPNDPQLVLQRAAIYASYFDVPNAIADYDRALELSPDDTAIYLAKAKLQRYTPAARDSYDKAVALNPHSNALLTQRADYFAHTSAPELARADYDTVLASDPGDRQSRLARAGLLLLLKQNDAARADLELLLQDGKTDDIAITALSSRATLFNNEKQYALALKDYDRIAELRPLLGNFQNSCWTRALVNVDVEHAMEYCDKAINAGGGYNFVATDARGLIFIRQGMFKEAIAALTPGINIFKQARSLYLRGVAKKRLGDSGADADIAAALKLDPGMPRKFAEYGIAP